jgi:hypothetical protein
MLRLRTAVVCVLALAAPAAADTKPVRVLLVAGAATREYQFVRNLLARDADKARLAVYLQAPPGRDTPRDGVEQGAKLLKQFPDEPEAYDVIVAFDPDWTRLTADQLKSLRKWVEGGGGLVLVAGPVNTLQLSRKAEAGKLRDVEALYPVKLGDSRLEDPSATAEKPLALHFAAGDDSPAFLKLDPEGKGPTAGWDAFFYGDKEEHKETERGFFGAYPVDSLKPAATVWASLADAKAKLADGTEAPFLVGQAVEKGRVVYLGAGEMWRLRLYRNAFFDRFWTGLIHYAAAAPAKDKEKEAPPDKAKSPDELGLEIAALRLLYAFDFTTEQRQKLAESAKETMETGRERKTTKVSDDYVKALTNLRDALAEASDEDAIDAKEEALDDLQSKESAELEDDVELTPPARKAAVDVFHRLKPSQLMRFLRRQEDEAADPQDRLVKALDEVRGLKGAEWKDTRDAMAEDVAADLAGVNTEKAEKVSDRVVALLSKARGLTAEEFKMQKPGLEKEAQEISASAEPHDVLRNRAEYALAQLMSNPKLAETLKARQK